MRQVYLTRLAYALGDTAESVAQAAASASLISPAGALCEAGFEQHHICQPATTSYALARQAVENLETPLERVDAIVYACCIPQNANLGDAAQFRASRDVKYLMDYPASHLQADLGLHRASVIGLTQQACSGMFGAVRLARALLLAEPDMQQVLCLMADRFPEGAYYEHSYNLVSDGATACLVSTEVEGFRVLACHAITNGAMAAATEDETVGAYFGYSHRLIQETLAKANLTLADIAWIIPQNINRKATQIMARLLRYDYERFYAPTLAQVGHMISGDNIVNLKHLAGSGRLQPGARVLLFLAGYGLNWQCMILEWRG
jgi:3-oxoacyl-[acyl-carrier-protein] synthase-3